LINLLLKNYYIKHLKYLLAQIIWPSFLFSFYNQLFSTYTCSSIYFWRGKGTTRWDEYWREKE